MIRRAALIVLGLSSPLILLTFIVGYEVIFALSAAAFPVALIALGAQRQGRLGPLSWPLAMLAVTLLACIGAMLWLRGQIFAAPWVGGLPLATAVQVYGLFLAPLALVSLAYAWTFERFFLPDDDLEELRRRFESPPETD